MALLEILHFPDPRLRKKAQPVDKVDDQIRQTVDDMLETMYAAPGIGLAATQVKILSVFWLKKRKQEQSFQGPIIFRETQSNFMSRLQMYEKESSSRLWIRWLGLLMIHQNW